MNKKSAPTQPKKKNQAVQSKVKSAPTQVKKTSVQAKKPVTKVATSPQVSKKTTTTTTKAVKKPITAQKIKSQIVEQNAKVGASIKKEAKMNWWRWLATICLLIGLGGFFLPFANLDANLRVNNPFGNGMDILPPKTAVAEVNLIDFITFKPVSSLKFFNRPIGDYQIAGQSVYQFLRTPMPIYDQFGQLASFISPSLIGLLESPYLKSQLTAFFPQNGAEIAQIASDSGGVLTTVEKTLTTANDISMEIHNESVKISALLIKIENYKMAMDVFFTITFALMVILAIVVLFFRKVSVKLVLIGSMIVAVMTSALSAALVIGGNMLQTETMLLTTDANHLVQNAITQLLSALPNDIGTIIMAFMNPNFAYFSSAVNVNLLIGSWLMLGGLWMAVIFLFWESKQAKK